VAAVPPIPFDILHEDNHLLVVAKPAGLLVQGDATGDPCLLDHARSYLAARYDKPGRVFIAAAHRLDRPVSGVVVLARTSKAAGRLSDAFRTRRVEKEYVAVVQGRPDADSGEVQNWLLKDARANRVTAVPEGTVGAKQARTRYTLLSEAGHRSLVSVEPITGRSHQLRVHLAGLGCPVVGDLRYGEGPGLGAGILLHCRRITLPHPIGGAASTFEAPLPALWRDHAPEFMF